MSHLNGIPLSRLPANAHAKFIEDVLRGAADDSAVSTGVLQSRLQNLQAAIELEKQHINVSRRSKITPLMDVVDAKRNKYYMCIASSVRVSISHPNDDVAKAAKKIKSVIDRYDINTRSSRVSRTVWLNAVVEHLQSDDYQDEVNQLGISQLVDTLSEVNAEMQTLHSRRTEEKASHVCGEYRVARALTDDAYRSFATRLETAIEDDGVEQYRNYVNYVNAVIANYKRNVISRIGRRKSTETQTDSSSAE